MNHFKKKKVIIPVVAAFILLVVLLFAWLYTGKMTTAKAAFFKATQLPAVLVNYQPITMAALNDRYALLNALPTNQVDLSDPRIKDIILEKLISDRGLQSLAAAREVKVSETDIVNLFDEMIETIGGGDEKKLEEALKNYGGLSKKEFQKQILGTALLEKGLRTWYFGQKELNEPLYMTAQNIIDSAISGQDFATLAEKFSKDEATAVFAGDSGFVETAQLSPDVVKGLENAKLDEIKIVPGFDGLHILKLLGKDNSGENASERVRLQHIFLEGRGYEEWFTKQTQAAKIIKLTNKLSF